MPRVTSSHNRRPPRFTPGAAPGSPPPGVHGAAPAARPATGRRWPASLALAPLLLAAGLLAAGLRPLPANAGDDQPEKLFVEVRKSLLLDLGEKVETVSITDTELADFVVAAKTQVLIHGKKEGTTSLVVWTVGGYYKRYDLVVRRGYATRQIMLSVRVAELAKNALEEYGVDYLVRYLEPGQSDRSIGLYPGGVGKPSVPLSAGTLPEFPEDTQLALHWLKGNEQFEALIHAMEKDGALKVLARPNLVCLDGEEASFLAGGEIPIPVAQTSSIGGTTITIEWREFGVQLRFVPTIVDSTLIRLEVEPEVSALDFNNAVSVGGFLVPALNTRKASTHVELQDGESLVIGGLNNSMERSVEKKIPLLGDIPLLGYLFKSTTRETDESELLIVVSPKIVEPLTASELPPNPW